MPPEETSIPLLPHNGAPVWRRLRAAPGDPPPEHVPGLDPVTVSGLFGEEKRPRCVPHGEGALVILRGVNLNPGAAPEDMISVRVWIDPEQVVTVQYRDSLAVDEVEEEIAHGTGPKTPGDFIVILADHLTDRMQATVDGIDTELDALEDALTDGPHTRLRPAITAIRRKVVTLRRFIAPQRDALGVLFAEDFTWQTKVQDRRLRDTIDRVTRLVEQLDEIHLRAAIFQEALTGYVTERLNRTMVVLSVFAGLFLPLSFIASVFGMNLAGIPGAASPYAFGAAIAAMLLIGVAEFFLFRRLRLF